MGANFVLALLLYITVLSQLYCANIYVFMENTNLGNYEILGPSRISFPSESVIDCAAACARSRNRISFAFDVSSKVCYLYQNTTSDYDISSMRLSVSPWKHFDIVNTVTNNGNLSSLHNPTSNITTVDIDMTSESAMTTMTKWTTEESYTTAYGTATDHSFIETTNMSSLVSLLPVSSVSESSESQSSETMPTSVESTFADGTTADPALNGITLNNCWYEHECNSCSTKGSTNGLTVCCPNCGASLQVATNYDGTTYTITCSC